MDYTVHGIHPGQNTGVVSHFLLQWIFSIQGLNPDLPQCRQIIYQLSHQGSRRILEWLTILSPVNLPDRGIELRSPAFQADSLPAELQVIIHLLLCKMGMIALVHTSPSDGEDEMGTLKNM